MQRSYTQEFRINAVKLAKEIGCSAAARQLKIPPETLYTWIGRAKKGEFSTEDIAPDSKKSLTLAEENKRILQECKMLKTEVAQLKRENEILEGAAAFFAARQKKWENG